MKKKYRARDIKAAIKSNNDSAASAELQGEGLESIKDRYYQMEEASLKYKEDDPQMADEIMNWWLAKLNRAAGEVQQQGIEQFIKEEGLPITIDETPEVIVDVQYTRKSIYN